jgi:hypothetical protein
MEKEQEEAAREKAQRESRPRREVRCPGQRCCKACKALAAVVVLMLCAPDCSAQSDVVLRVLDRSRQGNCIAWLGVLAGFLRYFYKTASGIGVRLISRRRQLQALAAGIRHLGHHAWQGPQLQGCKGGRHIGG